MDKVIFIFSLALVVVPAAIIDIRSRRIPNLLTLAGIIIGFGINIFLTGFSGSAEAGIGLLMAFGISLPLWLMGWVGAGDVKLVSAVGAIVGMALVLPVLAGVAIAGGVFALMYVIFMRLQHEPLYVIMMSAIFSGKSEEGGQLTAGLNGIQMDGVPLNGVPRARRGIPYAIPVAIGSLSAIVYLS